MAHGHNKSARVGAAHITQKWFSAKLAKDRKRDRAAKKARRKNRSSK